MVLKLFQAGFSEKAVLQDFVSASDKTGLAATSEISEDLIYLASEAWNQAPNQQKLFETHFDFLS